MLSFKASSHCGWTIKAPSFSQRAERARALLRKGGRFHGATTVRAGLKREQGESSSCREGGTIYRRKIMKTYKFLKTNITSVSSFNEKSDACNISRKWSIFLSLQRICLQKVAKMFRSQAATPKLTYMNPQVI